MECKAALTEASGDFEKPTPFSASAGGDGGQEGGAHRARRTHRVPPEHRHVGGTLVEVNCESDFRRQDRTTSRTPQRRLDGNRKAGDRAKRQLAQGPHGPVVKRLTPVIAKLG